MWIAIDLKSEFCFLVAGVNWLPWQQDRKSLSQPFEDTEGSNLVYGLPVDPTNYF